MKELSFVEERLQLEVIFVGTKEDLLDAIFDGVARETRFSELDKVADRGEQIDLRL